MPGPTKRDGARRTQPKPRATLRTLAEHLGLSQAAISLVLNDAPGARAIPEETKQRILRAAEALDYRPNPLARSLRARRSSTLGVLVPDLSDPYSARILGGVEELLLRRNYFFLIASHRHDATLIDRYRELLLQRRVDGLILVDTPPVAGGEVPVVAISRHERVKGVPRIVLDHERAATLALDHLARLGHSRIAVFRGQPFIADSADRWRWIETVAARIGLTIAERNVVDLDDDVASPEPGYRAAQKLLDAGGDFTALFAFNDTSAVGAIRAFREAGLRVPADVSVVGFDDWHGAAYHNPSLTTVRQPLEQMGAMAAELVLDRVADPGARAGRVVMVEPELIVRQSTAPAPPARGGGRRAGRAR